METGLTSEDSVGLANHPGTQASQFLDKEKSFSYWFELLFIWFGVTDRPMELPWDSSQS